MRKTTLALFTLATLVSTGSTIYGYQHSLHPKYSFQMHREKGYEFDFNCGGIEYTYFSPEGLNVGLSVLTNFSHKDLYFQEKANFSFNYMLRNGHTLYPVLSFLNTHHRIKKELHPRYTVWYSVNGQAVEEEEVQAADDKSYYTSRIFEGTFTEVYIEKKSIFSGIGWDWRVNNQANVSLEAGLFKDMKNSLLVQEVDKYWGYLYSNPSGYQGKAGLEIHWPNYITSNFNYQVSKTMHHAYWESALEATIKLLF